MTVAAAISSVQLAADGGSSPADVDPTTGHGPEWGAAAPIGLLIIVLMCVALYFLVKSMNRNIKKVPESFSPAKVAVGAAAGAGTADAGVGAPIADGAIDTAPGGTASDSTASDSTASDSSATDAIAPTAAGPSSAAGSTSAARPAE